MSDPIPSPPADPLLDLADSLASDLAAAFAGEATVAWVADPLADLADAALQSPRLWVVDASATLASESGQPYEDFGLLLILQQKLSASADRSAVCRTLSSLASRVARRVRGKTLEGAACVRVVRQPARDLDDLHTLDRYYAEIQTVWRRSAEDDL